MNQVVSTTSRPNFENEPRDVEQLRRNLGSLQQTLLELFHARLLDEARAVTAANTIEVVFLDYQLGMETGLDVLKGLRSAGFAGFAGAIICMTGQGSEYIAKEFIREGADDYLPKRDINPGSLSRAIAGAKARREQS